MFVCEGAKFGGFGVSEMGVHVDKRGDAVSALVLPHLAHEGSIEIWLAAEGRIDGWVAQKLGENDDLRGPVEDRV